MIIKKNLIHQKTTSIYNSYVTSGLISSFCKQPYIKNYFNGMFINNFTTNNDCKESSMIVSSDIDSRVPYNKCVELIIPDNTSDNIFFTIDFDQINYSDVFIYNENSKRFPVGTIESTYSSIDALKI